MSLRTDKAKLAKEKIAANIPFEKRSWTVPEFCIAENISEPTYYKLKARGLGPKEARFLDVVRITPEARLTWQHQMQSAKRQRAAKIENARAARSKRAGKASVVARAQKRKRAAAEIAATAG